MTIVLIVLIIALMTSSLANAMQAHRVAMLEANPKVVTEYKEIEVIKKAMCECGHPSSMHIESNTDNPNEGGCQQEFFELQGKKTTNSFKCFCVKYVGPEPYTDFFDAGIRQLDTARVKELN